MMFSMGEPLPYHHYGKSSLCLRLGRTAEVMVGHLGVLAGTGKGPFLVARVGTARKSHQKQGNSRVCSFSVEPGC